MPQEIVATHGRGLCRQSGFEALTREAVMGKTRLLPGLVGGQHASRALAGRRAGQLSWVGQVAALFVGVVGILTAAASPAAADQDTFSAGHANGGHLYQAPVTA